MPVYPTTRANTEEAQKYMYVLNELTDTWSDSSFAWKNFNRMAARYANGGRQAIIALETAGPGSFRFGPSDGSGLLAEPSTATYAEATLSWAPASASCQFNHIADLSMRGDRLSFINMRSKIIADTVEQFGYRMSHAVFIDTSNAVARVKTVNGGGSFTLYAEGESGANGTYGTKYMFNNGYSSFSANKTGTDPEVNADAISTAVDRINETVVFTGDGIANIVQDSYVFWGSKGRSSKGYGMTGLPVIVNDGVDYAVFEGRDRTLAANMDWRSYVSRNFGSGNIEQEIISNLRILEKRRPGKKTDVVWYGLATQQMHFNQMATTRRTMLPVSKMESGPVFQGGFEALMLAYGNRQVPILADQEYPDTMMWGLNWGSLGKASLPDGDPHWLQADVMGMQWMQIPETMNFNAELVGVTQLAAKDPGVNWVTTGIETGF